MAESGGNSRALNNNPATGDLSYGLWQINMIGQLGPDRRRQFGLSSNDALYDPATNARVARSIYQSQGIRAWGAYTNGSYRQFLPAAQEEFRRQTTVPAAPSLPPRSGASDDIRSYIKQRRTQDWHNPPYKTLLDIAREIAGRNGLALEIKGDVPTIRNQHEDQTNESDANFLTRLAHRYGLVIKPVDGRLLITVRGEGAVWKNLDLVQSDVESWRARTKQRQIYKKVKAKYIDRESRKEKTVTISGGSSDGSDFEMLELHRTEEDARMAAQAKLDGLTSGIFGIDLTMKGTPSLTAEGTITLKGFRAQVDGKWVIQSVSHTLSGRSMFTTSVQAGTEAVADSPDATSGSPGASRPGTGEIIATTGGDQAGPTRGRSSGAHLHSQVAGGLSEAQHRRLVDAAITVDGKAPSSFGQSRGHAGHGYPGIDFLTPSGRPIRLNEGFSYRNLGVQGALGLGVEITGPGGSFTLGHLKTAR
jgi:phage protein D